MIKTRRTVQSIMRKIIQFGGYIAIIAYTMLIMNTAWAFKDASIVKIFRLAELFMGVEILSFFFVYSKKVQKIVDLRKEELYNCGTYGKKEIVELERKNTKVRLDMLLSALLVYAVSFAVVRGLSFVSIQYPQYFTMYNAQFWLQFTVHVGLLIIPVKQWNCKEINTLDLGIPNTVKERVLRRPAVRVAA